MSIFTDRRMGFVRIAIEMINADPESIRLAMGDLIVVRAEIFPTVVEYTCLCNSFDPVRPGDVMPRYSARLHRGDDGRVLLLGWDKE